MAQPTAATPELIAGRYQLQRKLARGGMGEVFAATDLSTGTAIALKRMLPEAEQRRSLVALFMREYHALSELRHPRIIQVFDYGLDGGSPYFTMELLDGQDLGELSPMPYRDACRYLRDVASSLALLHARRILHRDLSPRNVRVTSTGSCKLLDFGAMVPFGIPPNLTGTPPCIAPEAFQGGALDQRTDLYSLGALAYALLTGRHAYAVTQASALPHAWMTPPQRPMRIVVDIPDKLDALIAALMSVDPARRPSSANEVIELLTAVAELEPDDSPAIARSFLVGSGLVGRDRERLVLQRQLKSAIDGKGSTLVLAGPAGSGRSRMLAEAAVLAQTCGLTALRLVARAESGAAAPMLRDLVLGVRQVAPRVAERVSRGLPLVAALATADGQLPALNDDLYAQLLQQLVQYVCDVAREQALMIAFDDLDRADAPSRALVFALSELTSHQPLVLVLSHNLRAAQSDNVTTIDLHELNHLQATQLVLSLFGEVPHLERVSEWIFAISRGSPKLTLELAEHLLNRGIVRHVAGAWVLPAEITEPVPASTSEALSLRLRSASSIAIALAEILSLRRGGAPAECFLDLAEQSSDLVFRGLDELVELRVFESAGQEYVFAQRELQDTVARSITPDRRQELHGRWADWLLAHTSSTDADALIDRQLEAGWHLVHTDRALQGADLLATVGPVLVDRRVAMASAIPAIERALELYERHGRALRDCLRLRAHLVMSSFLFDHRLADRYEQATLDALYPFTALPLVERLSRWLGCRAGFLLGMTWKTLCWCFRFGPRRGPHVIEALTYYGRSTMGLMGLRALATDNPRLHATLARMRLLQHAPVPILSMLHGLAKAISLNADGRWGEAKHLIERVVARLDAGVPMLTSVQEHSDLLTGALLLQGLNSSYREHSDALAVANRLEGIGTQLAAAAAIRVRMTYHMCRAEYAETQHYRRLLDLQAIQHGTQWQVDWIANPIEGLVGGIWNDLPMLRRALDGYEQRAAKSSEWADMRETVRIDYHFRRGDFAKVTVLGDAYIERHAPGTIISWTVIYGTVAFAYIYLGNPEHALAICDRALLRVSADDLEYIVMTLTLEAAHATALAMTGNRERAEQIFQTRLARQEAARDHVRAFQVLQHRLEMLRLLDDGAEQSRVLSQMRDAASASCNPNLIARVELLYERQAQLNAPPAAANDQFESSSLDADETSAVELPGRSNDG